MLDLQGTSWAGLELDGSPITVAPPSIEFDGPSFNQATVWTGCRVIIVEFVMDTDGAAMGFSGLIVPQPGCEAVPPERERAVLDAFSETEYWSVQSRTQITLHGGHDLVLVRPDT